MSRIFVCGLVNVETSCHVREFPISYSPIDYNFFGVTSVPSGVGLNVALALSTLSDEVKLLAAAGYDTAGEAVRAQAKKRIAQTCFVPCDETPQSVVLFDDNGTRKIYTDLKNVQELTLSEHYADELYGADAFCICNINFSRPLLKVAKSLNKPIFTDVHCISDVRDDYNAEFMRYADVLFLSNENIIGREEDFVRELSALYPCTVIVVGMGEKGALLFERGKGFLTSLR